jgi:hypothetical protein
MDIDMQEEPNFELNSEETRHAFMNRGELRETGFEDGRRKYEAKEAEEEESRRMGGGLGGSLGGGSLGGMRLKKELKFDSDEKEEYVGERGELGRMEGKSRDRKERRSRDKYEGGRGTPYTPSKSDFNRTDFEEIDEPPLLEGIVYLSISFISDL